MASSLAPPLAVLLTDFGEQDWFVGSLKAAILKRCPQATIVDLCHAIQPGAIRQGAFVLQQTFTEFPRGAAFCCVVDPGVGGARHAVAARNEDYVFFAPDNGLLSGVRARSQSWECFTLDNSAWMNPCVSSTFHGRDIFAPATGCYLSGGDLAAAGQRLESMVELELSQATRDEAGAVRAAVAHIDRFGNLLVDLSRDNFEAWGGSPKSVVRVGGQALAGIKRAFSDVPAGELLAYWGSLGLLEIAVNGGSCAKELGARLGDAVEIEL